MSDDGWLANECFERKKRGKFRTALPERAKFGWIHLITCGFWLLVVFEGIWHGEVDGIITRWPIHHSGTLTRPFSVEWGKLWEGMSQDNIIHKPEGQMIESSRGQFDYNVPEILFEYGSFVSWSLLPSWWLYTSPEYFIPEFQQAPLNHPPIRHLSFWKLVVLLKNHFSYTGD